MKESLGHDSQTHKKKSRGVKENFEEEKMYEKKKTVTEVKKRLKNNGV